VRHDSGGRQGETRDRGGRHRSNAAQFLCVLFVEPRQNRDNNAGTRLERAVGVAVQVVSQEHGGSLCSVLPGLSLTATHKHITLCATSHTPLQRPPLHTAGSSAGTAAAGWSGTRAKSTNGWQAASEAQQSATAINAGAQQHGCTVARGFLIA
jgi:hypothetical protein